MNKQSLRTACGREATLQPIIKKMTKLFADGNINYSQSQEIIKQVRKNLKQRKGIPSQKTASKKKQAERRFATILYSEITGYQEMLKSMEEEAVHTLMNRCTEIMVKIANKYGGTFKGGLVALVFVIENISAIFR